MTHNGLNKIAIFGGTFDPPHSAHRELISEIAKEFDFDKIVVVPSRYPPGKTAVADYQQRLNWVRRCFEALPMTEVSQIEETTQQTMFGEDIFRILSLDRSNTQFYWVVGEDQWTQLQFWKHIDAYASHIIWIVMRRERPASHFKTIHSRKLRKSSIPYLWAGTPLRQDISSSRIRDEISQNGENAQALKWIPDSIRDDVIKTYRKQGGII